MSNKKEATRIRILDSALKMLRERGPGAVTMADVAEQAGLTRQAVYVHFGSRTALMLALVDHIDAVSGLQEFLGPVRSAASGRDALDASLRMIARYSPRIHDVATAIDLARHTDEDAAAAWADRMTERRKSIGSIVRRIQREGALRPGFSVSQVVDAIWAMSLPHSYAALVVDRGWSVDDYERLLAALAGALVQPARPARPRSPRARRADRR
jgi:AcrR family transcriptional regulator